MAMLNNQRVYPQDKYGKTQTKNEPNGKMSVRIVYPLLIPLGVDLLYEKQMRAGRELPPNIDVYCRKSGGFPRSKPGKLSSRFSAGFSWQNGNVSSFEDEDDHIQVTWPSRNSVDFPMKNKVIVMFQFAMGQFTSLPEGIPIYSHDFPGKPSKTSISSGYVLYFYGHF
jgi:hypothetical protein